MSRRWTIDWDKCEVASCICRAENRRSRSRLRWSRQGSPGCGKQIRSVIKSLCPLILCRAGHLSRRGPCIVRDPLWINFHAFWSVLGILFDRAFPGPQVLTLWYRVRCLDMGIVISNILIRCLISNEKKHRGCWYHKPILCDRFNLAGAYCRWVDWTNGSWHKNVLPERLDTKVPTITSTLFSLNTVISFVTHRPVIFFHHMILVFKCSEMRYVAMYWPTAFLVRLQQRRGNWHPLSIRYHKDLVIRVWCHQ